MRTRRVVATILIVVGLVWLGQGVGLIPGSFMTGEAIWAVIGAVCIAFGVALLRGGRRSE
jgi:peptidoglycan/LPS O-acetylase OafA/YrhL